MSRELPWCHRVGFIRAVTGCTACDMHPTFSGLDDDRENGGPEAGGRIVIGMAANGPRMSVVVSERGLDGFKVSRLRVAALVVWRIRVGHESVDTFFS